MTFQRRRIGLTVLLTVALLWSRGFAQGQQAPLGPPELPLQPIPTTPPGFPGAPQIPLPEPSQIPKDIKALQPPATPVPMTETKPGSAIPLPMPEKIPSVPTPAPGPENVSGGKQGGEELPKDMGMSIKDIVIEATEGQTPSNPTGRQEPGVSVEWIYPSVVRLGQPVTCTIMVKSISINRLHQVVVRARVPNGATVKGSDPQATNEGDILVWNLGHMEPRQEKRIDVHMIPTVRGSLPCHAFVTFTGSSTAKLEVREPKLALKATAPKQALKGDIAIVALTVNNPGDARTEHVKVRVDLSEGLKYGNGKGTEILLENLGPGESRTFLLQCMAEKAGDQLCAAIATAEGGLEAKASTNLEVIAPQVDVVVSGPKMRYLDRNAIFSFKVTNPGTAPANHVTLTNQVPLGFKVVGATGGAFNDFATRNVVWFLGNLEPGQSKEVSLDLLAINPGEYKNLVTVTAARGLRSATEMTTRIEGLPGLLMELVDVQDPIEVGKELSYEIRLTNTGTKTESNLQVTCTIPDKMEFRGAKCSVPIPFKAENGKVVFESIPKLAPRADVIYRVNVLCRTPGDLRFQAQVTADGLESPVTREESTRVFGDDGEVTTVPSNNNKK